MNENLGGVGIAAFCLGLHFLRKVAEKRPHAEPSHFLSAVYNEQGLSMEELQEEIFEWASHTLRTIHGPQPFPVVVLFHHLYEKT